MDVRALERVWARSTCEINGMWGGHLGPGGKAIVPREAHAKLSVTERSEGTSEHSTLVMRATKEVL